MTDTATGEAAEQAATALRRLNRLIADAHATEQTPDTEKVAFYQHALRSAVVLGIAATVAGRRCAPGLLLAGRLVGFLRGSRRPGPTGL